LLENTRQHKCLENDILLLNAIIGIKYRKIKEICQGGVPDLLLMSIIGKNLAISQCNCRIAKNIGDFVKILLYLQYEPI